MNEKPKRQKLAWEEDPRVQNAQFWLLVKVLAAGFPIALLVSLYTGNLDSLQHYFYALGCVGVVGVVWWLVATLMYLVLNLGFWATHQVRRGRGR